jgi:hypothetical protein
VLATPAVLVGSYVFHVAFEKPFMNAPKSIPIPTLAPEGREPLSEPNGG